MAARDLLQAGLQGLDLEGRLVVDAAQQRLAEVGDLGSGEPADEAFRAHDAEVDAAYLADDGLAVQQMDPGTGEDRPHLVRAARVVVVVPEHRVDGEWHDAARIGEH
jgi:hypothetical protein